VIRYRFLGYKDINMLVEFLNSLSDETYRLWYHYVDSNSYDKACYIIEEDSIKLIAIDYDRIVGYGYLCNDVDYPNIPSLGIVVRDDYQNRGIGKEMLKHLIFISKSFKSISGIYLTCAKNNKRAFHLFSGLGWKVINETKDRYQMKLLFR